MTVPMKVRSRVAAGKKSSTARELAVPLILAGVPGPEIALRVGVSNSAIKKYARFFSGAMCAGQTGCGK
jgi:DNA-binding NarL/FixJ family response regulator